MGINITSIEEAIEDNGVKILVHGLAGAGKTVLCATTGSPTLILNVEGGLLSLKGAPSYIKTAKIGNIDEFEEVYSLLKKERDEGKQRFDWIALDSISDIAEAVLKAEMDICADPRKSYPAFQARVIELIKAFRDMEGYNVIMTAKQMMTKDDYTGITLRSPSMPGNKLGPQVPYLFDEVFALRVDKDEDGDDYRTLQTSRDIMFEAKDRSGMLDTFEPPSLKKILAKIHGKEAEEVNGAIPIEITDEGILIKDEVIYWEHSSGSVGECLSSEFADLCDDADGEIEEISQDRYDKKMAEKSKE